MGRYESNPNSFVDIVRFVGVVIAYNSVLGCARQLAVCGVAALSFCKADHAPERSFRGPPVTQQRPLLCWMNCLLAAFLSSKDRTVVYGAQ
eukprot:scaffold7473_cov141-Skeletonema_marinoi.AAC.12